MSENIKEHLQEQFIYSNLLINNVQAVATIDGEGRAAVKIQARVRGLLGEKGRERQRKGGRGR